MIENANGHEEIRERMITANGCYFELSILLKKLGVQIFGPKKMTKINLKLGQMKKLEDYLKQPTLQES